MTFDEQPRDLDGKFGEKTGSAPQVTLTAPADFQAVDDLWRQEHEAANGNFLQELYALDRAASASRLLRENGMPVIPSDREKTGLFADCANVAELRSDFEDAMSPERITGDGEATIAQQRAAVSRTQNQYGARVAELRNAGVDIDGSFYE